ncbi:MAG: ion transporter [Pseudomonadota bacterium]
MSELRQSLTLWIESAPVTRLVTILIVINAIALGVETSSALSSSYGDVLLWLERVVIALFTLEILIKLYCYRLDFFRSGWNLMDFVIVAVSLVPNAGPFAILRSLRILRVLRLLSTVPRLRQLTESLLSALPSIGWVVFMLALVFYVFGVLGTELFGERFPQWFGSLGASIYSLFQIMTLESWSMGIARPVMAQYPYAWAYFVPFILISAFTILNLFIGIIVNSMQAMHWEEEEAKRLETEEQAHREREEMLALIRTTARTVRELEARLLVDAPLDQPEGPEKGPGTAPGTGQGAAEHDHGESGRD